MPTGAESSLRVLRSPRPPYVAFVSFEVFLERMRDAEVPERVNQSVLNEWGIARGNESSLLTSLRALDIIDEDGRPTDLYMPLRLSAQRRQEALRQCAIRAYPGLIDPNGVPRYHDEDAIHDQFVEHAGLRGQMADKATRFFRNFIGLIEVDRAGTSSSSRSNLRDISRRVGANVALAPQVVDPSIGSDPPILLTLAIPANATEAQLVEMFRKVRRAWRRVSDEAETQE